MLLVEVLKMNIRVCPRCNSPNVTLDHAIWWGDRIYCCKRCKYQSSLFPEIEVKDIKELKKLRLRPVKKGKTAKRKGKARAKSR